MHKTESYKVSRNIVEDVVNDSLKSITNEVVVEATTHESNVFLEAAAQKSKEKTETKLWTPAKYFQTSSIELCSSKSSES